MKFNFTIDTFPRLFSYYSFDSMMSLCSSNEIRSMPHGKMNSGDGDTFPFPWELATFAMLACSQKEYGDIKMQPDEFSEFINYIRHNWISPAQDYNEAIDKISFQLVPEESQYQENRIIRFLRYNWIFNFANDELSLPVEISNNFDVAVPEILNVLFAALVLPESGVTMTHVLAKIQAFPAVRLSEPFFKVLRVISIKHDKFVKKQRLQIRGNETGWRLVCNWLSTYPVVKKGRKCYIPVTFLIENALTVRLLGRMTWTHPELRGKFGKEALESYLIAVFKGAGCYKEVRGEIKYHVGKNNEIKTPDVIVKSDNGLLLIDSKASEPPFALRQLDEKKKLDGVSMYSDHIVQLCKRMHDFTNGFVEGYKYDSESMFGVVSVYQDSYFDREKIYEFAFEELNVDEEMKRYYRGHTAILDIRELEMFCYYGTDIVPSLKLRLQSENGYKSVTLDKSSLAGKGLIKNACDTIDAYSKRIIDFLIE